MCDAVIPFKVIGERKPSDRIIWRHAKAEDEQQELDDLQRSLTPRGEKQAGRMAQWLDLYLPDSTHIPCSAAAKAASPMAASAMNPEQELALLGRGPITGRPLLQAHQDVEFELMPFLPNRPDC